MSTGRRLVSRAPLWLAVLVIGVYGFRAITGVIGGFTYLDGLHLAAVGRYKEALPILDRAAIGFHKAEVLWLRGQVRVGLWDSLTAEGRPAEEIRSALEDASRDYLAAAAACPVAAWPWAALAEIYDRVEWEERDRRTFDLASLSEGAWDRVGRSGAIAVGMMRGAIERNPTQFEYWDQLALMLMRYGLREEGLEAVRGSARAQPAFNFHSYRLLPSVPDDVVAAFAGASRGALANAPMLQRRLHVLSLGRLGRRLGDLDQAESDLRAALLEPGSPSERAQGHYWLGLVLLEQGRLDEAEEELWRSSEHERFTSVSLAALASAARERQDPDKALELLWSVRRLEPRSLPFCLQYAEVARELELWPEAAEALKWAILTHPEEVEPRRLLVETYVAAENRVAASLAWQELRRRFPDHPDTERLGALLDAAPR